MANTRPSGYPLIPPASATVLQEVAEIDKRGRLHLLPRWIERFDWLSHPKDEAQALMVFSEPGRLEIHPWLPDGPRVVARWEEIATHPDDHALEALRLLQDRFSRLKIQKERRVYLGDPALAHLGLPIERGTKSIVYVAIFPTRIDILGPSYRNAKLEASDPWLDGLP